MARFDYGLSVPWLKATWMLISLFYVSPAASSFKSDPFYLKAWVNDDPIPQHLITQAQQHGSSSLHFTQHHSSHSNHTNQRRQLHQAIRANALNVRPGLRAKPSAWATATINPKIQGFGIPSTFLGISHEWTNIQELNQQGTYLQLLQDLTAYGGGPLVLRIGGGSTDRQTAPPSEATFSELKQLQYSTGMMFIFGLNFRKGDVGLAQRQIDAIWANMPVYSVMSFEVGNEPNFYYNINGKSAQEYIACCFVNEWEMFVRRLSCKHPEVKTSTCTTGQFSGPAWGHVNMFPATLDWFLKVNYPYINMVTVHWYHSRSEDGTTAQSLLDEQPLRNEMTNLKRLVDVSRRYGKDLRVGEMNTISNSGRDGVSNSMAAALWTLDGALEVAQTGAVGINLHWGDGLSLYAALLRQSSGAAYVKPPYYAYLLFQMALGKGARLVQCNLQANPGSKIKIYALQDFNSGVIRVVLINKHATATVGVNVRLPSGYLDGKLIRLLGKQGLQDEWSIRLGNMTYNLGGKPFGVPTGEMVLREPADGSSGLKYTVFMPAASAALLVIPRQQ